MFIFIEGAGGLKRPVGFKRLVKGKASRLKWPAGLSGLRSRKELKAGAGKV